MDPYYLLHPLPGEERRELPDPPAVRAGVEGQPADAPRVVHDRQVRPGQLRRDDGVRRCPRASTVLGPGAGQQRRSRHDPEISSELTLLNQQGSSVIQGSLQLIPVGRLDRLRAPDLRRGHGRAGLPAVPLRGRHRAGRGPGEGRDRGGRAHAALPELGLTAPPDVRWTRRDDRPQPTTDGPDRPDDPVDHPVDRAGRHHRGAAARRGERPVRRRPGRAPGGRLRPLRRRSSSRSARPDLARPEARGRQFAGGHADHHDHPAPPPPPPAAAATPSFWSSLAAGRDPGPQAPLDAYGAACSAADRSAPLVGPGVEIWRGRGLLLSCVVEIPRSSEEARSMAVTRHRPRQVQARLVRHRRATSTRPRRA